TVLPHNNMKATTQTIHLCIRMWLLLPRSFDQLIESIDCDSECRFPPLILTVVPLRLAAGKFSAIDGKKPRQQSRGMIEKDAYRSQSGTKEEDLLCKKVS